MTDSSDNLTKSWVYNSAGLPVLMHILFNGAFHDYGYLYDGQGRITGLVDESTKQRVVTYTYDAWGNVSYTENPAGLGLAQQNPFVYHGYWYDWNTGLYYLNARYYNPSIGRFLSEDTVAPQVGDVLSYNKYAYAGNNPVNMIDPTGQVPLLKRLWNAIKPPSLSQEVTNFNNELNFLAELAMPLDPADGAIVKEAETVDEGILNLAEGTGKLDKPTAGDNISSRLRGEKGKSFRGGSKSVRDNWYGYNNKDFQNWWHRVGKSEWGGEDIQDSQMAKDVYEYWVEIGKPKVK